MGDLTLNFSKWEFKCKCGCGLYIYNEDFVVKVQRVRDRYKKRIGVNSGTRCSTHNKKEGGSDTSSHLDGIAGDLEADNMFLLLRYTIQEFDRLGIAETFIHVDNDKNKKQEIYWIY